MENPFKFGSIVRGPYFAEQENGLKELAIAMQNLERVFLVSPRRYGKTCLLFNLMERLKGKGLAAGMALGPDPRGGLRGVHLCGWLERGQVQASREDLIRILELGEDVPYNIQRLCHNLWEVAPARDTKAGRSLIEQLPEAIARQDSPHYELLWRGVTPSQRLLLMALASTPQARPFSREFQLRHGIGPSSSIKASLDSLVRKGILLQERSGLYRFTDTFFPRWMECMSRAPGKTVQTP